MIAGRIVSLNPAATAWLAEFGAGDLVVGGTASCPSRLGRPELPVVTRPGFRPAEPRALVPAGPTVRSADRDLDVETFRSLSPDLVITNGWDETWGDDLGILCASAQAEEWAWEARSYRDVLELVLRLGRRTGRMHAAMKALGDREAELRDWRERIGIHRRAPDDRLLRTIVLTSMQPPVLAAGWMGELVDRAALVLVGGVSGAPAARWNRDDVEALDPAFVVVALPGLDIPASAALVSDSCPEWMRPREGRRVILMDTRGRMDEAGPGLHETILDLAATAWRLPGRDTAGRILEITA